MNRLATSPRRNRVDPWGDLHAVSSRGLFTGNRGCLLDDERRLVRHHAGSLWIICRTRYRGWRHPLDAPRTWTPLFFLDDSVALAAGHRPCGLCRRDAYRRYQAAIAAGDGGDDVPLAPELNRRLNAERLRRGRGLDRAAHRHTTTAELTSLPSGVVVLDRAEGRPRLLNDGALRPFGFDGWGSPISPLASGPVEVLTPPTSVLALANGFQPELHHTARHL